MTAVTTKPVISGEADILGLAPVIPVVVVAEVAQAVPLARALLRGGIPGTAPIGGNELFDLRTRLQSGIRFV